MKLLGNPSYRYSKLSVNNFRHYIIKHISSSQGWKSKDTENETFREKVKKTWNGPTFKYWFIGVTGFTSWMFYYSLKNYKKKCLDIELLPCIPNHHVIEREKDLYDLHTVYDNQQSVFDRSKVKIVEISGVSGSGKTVLFCNLLNILKSANENKIQFPKSNIKVTLNADTDTSFLISLKTFAAKLKIHQNDLEEKIESNQSFFSLSIYEQCNIILECIQDALDKHPGWIICFDNLQATTPMEVKNLIKSWFFDSPLSSNWSRGTLFLICDGKSDSTFNVATSQKYQMKSGLSTDDSVSLIQSIVNIDENFVDKKNIVKLSERIYGNPIGVVCLGLLLKQKLSQIAMMSIDDAVESVINDLNGNVKLVVADNEHLKDFINTFSGLKLLTLQTSIAMAMKYCFHDNSYLKHGFDFVATLKPSSYLTQNLLNRHLMNSFYKLPLLGEKSPGLLDVLRTDKQNQDTIEASELDPKGKLWSNKNLAEYMKKVEDFFITGWKTVKEIYNLIYGELPPLPPRNDGLDMFRSCQLLRTGYMENGECKTMSMHPIIYNVARQHYLANTVYALEQNHLTESQTIYNKQPWYKKMSSFSDQACLHQYRMSSIDKETLLKQIDNPERYLSRYNMGINVSSVLNEKDSSKLTGFYAPTSVDKFHYLQAHLTRTIESIAKEIEVSKDDSIGRNTRIIALDHLEYIVNNQPIELLEMKTQVVALETMAKLFSKLYNRHEQSENILEKALSIERENVNSNPLHIAKTMTQLAEVYIHSNKTEKAKVLLLEAAELYEKDRRKYGEYKQPFEFGVLLGLLGVVYGTLGMKQESKETIERSLMLLQAQPPDTNDEAATKKFGGDFASALTDLGHSYVSLGLPLYGKKILDLALAAHKNIHGENHSEVVRTLTVLAIAHLMQGHNEESKKLRSEAGKIQQSINALPMY